MEYFTVAFGLIAQIPSTFWGVIAGSFFTLIGIVLTNRATDKRLRSQFLHDKEQSKQEADAALRKDIYLEAAEAITTAFLTIGKFANLDIPFEHLTDDYSSRAAAIGKIQIVAREETWKCVLALNSAVGGTMLRLTAMRMTLVAQKQNIAVIDGLIESFSRQRDRMLELLTANNIEGASDKRKLDVIQNNVRFEIDRIDSALKQKSALTAQLYPAQLNFAEQCTEEIIRLNALMVPAVVAIRAELELPFDAATYEQMMGASMEQLRSEFVAFLAKAKAVIPVSAAANG